jgi:hypothetical protein
METLYKREEFAPADASESVVNILARYSTVEELFPGELKGWWDLKMVNASAQKCPTIAGLVVRREPRRSSITTLLRRGATP